ncbi:MAG: AAC(3) family N-acetyltransferase [Bacteroidetes bacterium]|nr:AAC(3) family N-acetyltransferase [Bacteroidota bacterium]
MKERIYSILKLFFPFVLVYGKRLKKYIRRRRLHKQELLGNVVSQKQLEEDLAAIGLQKGDSVIVHSSLRKIGVVQGGAQAVIDALLNVLTPNGTLLCPTSTANKLYKHYLEENPVFDVRNTPSLYGTITETFRKMPGVKRSIHPTESVAAKGPLASYFVEEHFNQLTPYNDKSPFYKLCLKNGKILLLGVKVEVCINLHVVEDLLPSYMPDVYYPKNFKANVIDYEGVRHTVDTKVHDPKYAYIRKPNSLQRYFDEAGIIKHGKIGNADAMLIDANEMLQCMIRIFNERGITMYSPNGISK